MAEPVLDRHDIACWQRLRLLADRRSKTTAHRRLVDAARRVTARCLGGANLPVVMWSAGKDSTCLAHLVTVDMGAAVPLVSEKDDLDYPGEEDYVEALAGRWGAQLEIIRPTTSPAQWVAEHARSLKVDGDFHSRAAGLSKECFYRVVEQATADNDALFLGLRAEESKHRANNRRFNGLMYRRKDGKTVCNPLGDWTGLDVYAYLAVNGIDPLSVYRCIGFLHSREPWRVRKSWWLPGAGAKHGEIAWLRRYYPSLFRKLLEWFPRAQGLS